MKIRVIESEAVPIPNRDSTADLAGMVGDGFELIRQRFAAQDEKIRALIERVQDLEGHVEHGPAGTCGVCDPEPEPDDTETVGANSYGQNTIAISDFTGDCDSHDPACDGMIVPGEKITPTAHGWRHHDCAR